MNVASPNLLKMIEILSIKATSLQDLHKILGKSVKQIKRNLDKLKEQGYDFLFKFYYFRITYIKIYQFLKIYI